MTQEAPARLAPLRDVMRAAASQAGYSARENVCGHLAGLTRKAAAASWDSTLATILP